MDYNFELLFWKVFKNKYLFNLIFKIIQDESIEYNNISKYYLGHRIQFSKIKNLSWFVDHKEYKILEMKLKANERIIYDYNVVLKFLNSINSIMEHEEVLNLFFDKYYDIFESESNLNKLIKDLIESSNLEALKYLFSKYNIRINKNYIKKALSSKSVEIVQYLYKLVEEESSYSENDNGGDGNYENDDDLYNFQDTQFKKEVFLLSLRNSNDSILEYIIKNPNLYGSMDGYCKISWCEFNKINSQYIKNKLFEMDFLPDISNYLFTISNIFENGEEIDRELLYETIKVYYLVCYRNKNKKENNRNLIKFENLPNNIKQVINSCKMVLMDKIYFILELFIKDSIQTNLKIDKSILMFYLNHLDGKILLNIKNHQERPNQNSKSFSLDTLYQLTLETCNVTGLELLFELDLDFINKDFNGLYIDCYYFANGSNNQKIIYFLKLFHEKSRKLMEKLSFEKMNQIKRDFNSLKNIDNNKKDKKSPEKPNFTKKQNKFIKPNIGAIELPKCFIEQIFAFMPIQVLEILLKHQLIPVKDFIENKILFFNSDRENIKFKWFLRNEIIKSALFELENSKPIFLINQFYNFSVISNDDLDFIINIKKEIRFKNLNISLNFSSLKLLKQYKEQTGEDVSKMVLEVLLMGNEIYKQLTLDQLKYWLDYLKENQYFRLDSDDLTELMLILLNIFNYKANKINLENLEFHQLISPLIDLSLFPTIHILFNFTDLSVIKLILENDQFSFDNSKTIFECKKYIEDSSKHNLIFHELKFSNILSLVKYLSFKLSDNSINLLSFYFKKLYNSALLIKDITIDNLIELNNYYIQFSIPVKLEFYHFYHFFIIKSKKFLKYLNSVSILKDEILKINKFKTNNGDFLSTHISDIGKYINYSNFSLEFFQNSNFNEIFLKLRNQLMEFSNGLDPNNYKIFLVNDLDFCLSIHNIELLEILLNSLIDNIYDVKNLKSKWVNTFYQKLNQNFNETKIKNLNNILKKIILIK